MKEEVKATFTLRMPRDLGGQVQKRANAARMSMNAWVLRAIDVALIGGRDAQPHRESQMIINRSDIERRALLAYRKAAARQGVTYQEPGGCEVHEIGDSTYARLSNVNGVLAVYCVRPDGKLEGMKCWPAELN